MPMLTCCTKEGELADLLDEFSEGKVQFAFVKVIDPNTGLPKNVLIAWCGEGVPERTKGSFTSHLAAVSKFLHVRSPLAVRWIILLMYVHRFPGLSRSNNGTVRW